VHRLKQGLAERFLARVVAERAPSETPLAAAIWRVVTASTPRAQNSASAARSIRALVVPAVFAAPFPPLVAANIAAPCKRPHPEAPLHRRPNTESERLLTFCKGENAPACERRPGKARFRDALQP